MLDPDVCYEALKARDARFDGRLFVAVTTTGVYCRPVCPASLAKRQNCRFFPSAAAAQDAGFRPCLRCRPETAPEHGSWRGSSNTVSRGLSLIAEGALDRDDASIDELAERLGVGGRQLRRLFQQHLGASPIAVAQTRRVLFAKQLIHETNLPMAEVALAAGFGSVRRFNETFQRLYARPPSALRHRSADRKSTASGVSVRLRYRAPYDWTALLGYLRARAVDGVEHVDDERYVRTARHEDEVGVIEVRHEPDERCLVATVRFPSVRALPALVTRIRRVFDLGADLGTIGAHLAEDAWLGPLVAARPGLRSPGAWDGFELAVRAILGQQVSVAAARRLNSELVRLCDRRLPGDAATGTPCTLVFPAPADVLRAKLERLPVPGARRRALVHTAEAALADPTLFEPRATIEETVLRLTAVSGIGEWTAQYIALRAGRDPDAFPASDAGLLRGAGRRLGARPSPAELLERAERWRPFRAYAAEHLWAADAAAASGTGAPDAKPVRPT